MRTAKERLADNFERVAKDFYTFIEDNGLEETEVDMEEGRDKRDPDLNLCDTPACHGGWAAIMYDVKWTGSPGGFYFSGSDILAEKLGFSSIEKLEWWAKEYPEYWGNFWGALMFSSNEAFNRSFKEALHLKAIADWYMNVAKRLRGSKVKLLVKKIILKLQVALSKIL